MQQPPPTWGPPPPGTMVTKVDLTISCDGLRDLDVLSKSDPICAVFSFDGGKRYEVCWQ